MLNVKTSLNQINFNGGLVKNNQDQRINVQNHKDSHEFSRSLPMYTNNKVSFTGFDFVSKIKAKFNKTKDEPSLDFRKAFDKGKFDKCDEILKEMEEKSPEELRDFIFFKNEEGETETILNYTIDRGKGGTALKIINFLKNLKGNDELKEAVALHECNQNVRTRFSDGYGLSSFEGGFNYTHQNNYKFSHYIQAIHNSQDKVAFAFLQFLETLPVNVKDKFASIGGKKSQFEWTLDFKKYELGFNYLKFIEGLSEEGKKESLFHTREAGKNEFEMFLHPFIIGYTEYIDARLNMANYFMSIVKTLPVEDQEEFAKRTKGLLEKTYLGDEHNGRYEMAGIYLDFVKTLPSETKKEIARYFCKILRTPWADIERHNYGTSSAILKQFFRFADGVIPDELGDFKALSKASGYSLFAKE